MAFPGSVYFFSLQAIGAKGLRKPLYRPPRRRVHIWRQSGLVPRTSDKVYGGHRVFTANRGGYRAVLGQLPRHFARSLHGSRVYHIFCRAFAVGGKARKRAKFFSGYGTTSFFRWAGKQEGASQGQHLGCGSAIFFSRSECGNQNADSGSTICYFAIAPKGKAA